MVFRIERSRYVTIIGWLIIASACSNLIGWQFDITRLKSLIPGTTPMNPVTACTFILCGAWLLIYQRRKFNKLLLVVCGIVTFIGLIHFISYFFPSVIRMDFLFYGDKIKNSHIPNLIAPNTALVFFFSGITMCKVLSHRKWVLAMRQTFIMASFSLVYISILGYVFDITPAYRLGGYTPMSLFTALTFLLFNIGLFLSNTEFGVSRLFTSSLNGSRLLRKGLIILLIVPPVTGYLRLLGEKKGLYPSEFGVELNTFLFSVAVLIFLILYASLENKKQLLNIRTEKQLAANELKFRTVFHSLKEGIACIDFSGKILYCNPSYCDIVGYTERELVGNVVIEMIISDADRPKFYELLEERKSGKESDYETKITRKNKENIWISIKSKTMTDEQGNAYAYLVSVNDITEERDKIQDLQAFSGSAAHDLNGPIGRIITLSEFLADDSIDEVERKMFLSGISETAHSMRQLLQDLLVFSRLSTTQLEKKELNIDKMVREIIAVQRPKIFNGEILINALPPVWGNEGAVKQLFTNLISNAIKYSSKKEQSRIEIGAISQDGQTMYYIKDNGVGLTQEQINTLFTPFKRYHSDFEGNGLGLAIVKRVVEKHSGNIWAESVPGNGLTFHFTLSSDSSVVSHKSASNE